MATSNKKNVTEYLLTKTQISGGQYDPSEVYYIKDSTKELGPFWQEDLKEFIEDYNLLNNSVTVKSLTDTDWMAVTTHPLFQRRRPEILKEFAVDEDDKFYVLKNNKKAGPFTGQEIMTKLDALELLHTDYISVDEGQSWGSIHEFEVFDRRNRTNAQLPQSPQGHIFQNSILDADKAIALSKQESQDREFIYDLAYIGNQKLNPNKAQIEDFEKKDTVDSSAMVRLTAFAMSFVLVAAVFFTYSKLSGTQGRQVAQTKNSRNSVKKQRVPAAQNERKEASTVKKKTNTRVSKRKTQPSRPRRDISRANEPINDANFLSDTRNMDDGQVEATDIPQEYIFDDNTEALELDPIRQRVSKETFDPQEEELDNYNEIDAAREIVDDYLDRAPAGTTQEAQEAQDFAPEDAVDGEQY